MKKTLLKLTILTILLTLPRVGSTGASYGSLMTVAGNSVATGHWSNIRLNEIMYDPTGSDDQDKPNGEWVELYNVGTTSVDVAGWKIKNDSGHEWAISATNSDNNSNPSDGGESVVPAGGYLVTYNTTHSETLHNSGDTVYLYENHDVLIDSHSYHGGKIEGMTEAIIGGVWVDPYPTPCAENSLDAPKEASPSATPSAELVYAKD